MNYGIGNVKGKGGGGKTYFYADFDDLTYDSSTARYTIDKDNVWCNFLSTLQTSNDLKVGDFLYACNFNVNGNGMVKLLLEITSVGSTDLTLSECLDYAEQSSGIYYTNATLNAVGQTTQVALSNIQVNTNNSRNVLHENDLIIDANKKVGAVVGISNDVATIFSFMELGGGKQLYIHNIKLSYAGCTAHFTIINDSVNSLDTLAKIRTYLYNNDLNLSHPLMASGEGNYNSQGTNIIAVSYNTYEGEARLNLTEGYTTASQTEYHTRTREIRPSDNPTITDIVITL